MFLFVRKEGERGFVVMCTAALSECKCALGDMRDMRYEQEEGEKNELAVCSCF